jgi:hypothetical protein
MITKLQMGEKRLQANQVIHSRYEMAKLGGVAGTEPVMLRRQSQVHTVWPRASIAVLHTS